MTTAQSPRLTTGKFFAALLTCPQWAWLEYHGDVERRLPPPADLRAMQREGMEVERHVYQEQYPDAPRIPERLPTAERVQQTIAAMRTGSRAVLQGCLARDDGMGVVDILEHVRESTSSPTGHIYRVGEIKRASDLGTGHVFQALWYNELLSQVQGESTGEIFFYLGDGTRRTVKVTEAVSAYEQCKSSLLALREDTGGPGPHLCKSCLRCPWRGVCLPQLKESQHLSLLPGVGRRQTLRLAEAGVCSWADLPRLGEADWERLGFDTREVATLCRAVRCLQDGAAVTRSPVRAEVFQDWTAVAVEFAPAAPGTDAWEPLMLWYEDVEAIGSIPLREESTGQDRQVALTRLLARPKLATYGATDAVALQQVATAVQLGRRPAVINVVDIVEELVHAPLLSLELHALAEQLAPGRNSTSSGGGRVQAIRLVLDWVAGGRVA